MTRAEFERFPFSFTGTNIAPGELIARDKSFIPTRHIQNIIEEVAEEEEPPPPTFSEQELKEAEEIAYRKGFDDGERKGLSFAQSEVAKIEQAALDMLPNLTRQMQQILAHYTEFTGQHKQMLPKLSLAIGKKLYGELPPEHMVSQLEKHTIACIEVMLGEPELHVHVHPDLSDIMEQRLAAHFANSHEPGDVLIHKDEKLALSDCRIEWRTGGMEYSANKIMHQLEALVESISASATNDHQVTLLNTDGEDNSDVSHAVAGAIAGQLAKDEIPPIPEDPMDKSNPTGGNGIAQTTHITPDQGGKNE